MMGGSVAAMGATGAALLVLGESSALAIDFTDQSMYIVDTATPANNYQSTGVVAGGGLIGPGGKLTYTSPSNKLCRQSDGVFRYGAHNLHTNSGGTSGISYQSKCTYQAAGDGELDPRGVAAYTTTESSDVGAVIHRAGTIASFALAGATYTYSIDVKADGRSWMFLDLHNTTSCRSYFDLANGVVGSHTASATYVSHTMESLGDDWYRCKLVFTTSKTNPYAGWGTANADGGASYQGDGRNAIYVSNESYQISRYPANSDWLPAAAAARYALPYSYNTSGVCEGILVEEARTNLFLNSRVPVTQNVTVSATPYTLSFFGTGSITLSGVHSATLNGTGANDRVSLTFTPSAGTLTCTVTGSIDLVQVEAGSFPTSPIITYGATATRAADNISIATSAFPYSATAGTLYSEYAMAFDSTGYTTSAFVSCGIDDGSTDNMIRNQIYSGNVQSYYRGTSSTTFNVSIGAYVPDSFIKHAQSWENAVSASAVVDGGTVYNDSTLSAFSSPTTFRVGNIISSSYLNGHIKALSYVPRRKSDAELQAETA